MARDELPFAGRKLVPTLTITQQPSTTTSPAVKSTPKMILLYRGNQFGRVDLEIVCLAVGEPLGQGELQERVSGVV
jgi:hypothetical protein